MQARLFFAVRPVGHMHVPFAFVRWYESAGTTLPAAEMACLRWGTQGPASDEYDVIPASLIRRPACCNFTHVTSLMTVMTKLRICIWMPQMQKKRSCTIISVNCSASGDLAASLAYDCGCLEL